jgi:hypothetical protein
MKTAYLAAAAGLAVLSLTACDKADKGPKTMEQAKQEAAKLDRPKPGMYKQTMTVTQFEIPGAPPQAAAQLKNALGQKQDHSFCLTEAMSEGGFRDMFNKLGKDGACKYERFDVSGGKLDALLHCENAREGKGTIALAGAITAEGSDVTVSIDQQGGPAPMGNAKIGMHLVTERTGDCTPEQAAKK